MNSSPPPPSPPLQTLQIPGPTLAALLHLCSFSTTLSGHLFGHLSLSLSPISDSSPSSYSTLSLTLSSFLSTTTTTSSPPSSSSSLIGAFASRRRSPLRLSLLDYHHCLNSINQSQSQHHDHDPFVFLLVVNNDQNAIDTFEFKAFQFRVSTMSFDPIAVEIVNIGPGFRAGYGSFSPNSRLPYLGYERAMGSPMREDEREEREVSLGELRREKEGMALEAYAEGYDVGSLGRLMGGMNVKGIEELYGKMLGRLEGLAREVEVSEEKVIEKEKRNNELRYKVLGLGA
ncbi:hypothetical protein Droror1_Dr00025882 [Drosera rotundifolia]